MSPSRTFIGACTLLLLGTVLAGCSGSVPADPQPTPSGAASTTDSQSPASLSFSVYGDRRTVEAYREIADAYVADNPAVTIDVEASTSAAAARAKLDASLARKSPPDLFMLDHGAAAGYAADGVLQPVDALLEEREVEFADAFQRAGLEAFSAESALQCMPVDVSPMVVYYNSDLLRLQDLTTPDEDPLTTETGWTWEQFARAARMMSSRKVRGLYVDPDLLSLLPLVRSAGADIVDDPRFPTTLTMEDGDTRSALETILGLVRDPAVSPTPRELVRKDAVTRFEDGQLGMLFGSRALVPRLRKADGLRFNVFPMPALTRFTTLSQVTGICIAADSPDVEAAADFVAYASRVKSAAVLARSGSTVPANLPALHSAAFMQPGREPGNAIVFADGARRSESTPFAPAWPLVLERERALVRKMFYTPVLVLDRLLPRMDRLSERLLAPPVESPTGDSTG